MSNTLNEQLIELHLQHELNRLTPSELEKDITIEVEAFLNLADKHKLKDLLTIDQLNELILPQLEGSAKLDKAIKNIVLAIYNDKIHEKTSLGHLIQQNELEEVIDKVLEFDELRDQLLSDALHSNIAKDVITDLLYSGITRYIAQTNELTKKVPGAKAMMKFGKGILNNAAPALEDRVEKQVKKTIHIALPEIISQSENFISKSITDDNIKEIAISVWQGLEDQPIASARKHIDEDSVTDITEMILSQIHRNNEAHSEETPQAINIYIRALYKTGTKAFYKEYGNKKLSILLNDIGLDAQVLNTVLKPLLPPIITNLKDTGFLEERLRARLNDFYTSQAVTNLLAPK